MHELVNHYSKHPLPHKTHSGIQLAPQLYDHVISRCNTTLTNIHVGQRVRVALKSATTKKEKGKVVADVLEEERTGILKYVGPHLPRSVQCGVRLDSPVGDGDPRCTDGTLDGVTYFRCDKGHGVFAASSTITRGRGWSCCIVLEY